MRCDNLRYFYADTKEVLVSKAAEVLNVTPQTVSDQLTTFEDFIAAHLFERQGKRLEPNSLGQTT